jgi:transcriptional regulator with XRE-family HTH domain
MKGKKNAKREPLDAQDQLKKLGNRLRQLRLKKGFTNMDIFAYEHGFSRAQYGRYETGKDLQFTTLIRLINCFEMDLDDFFSEGFE